MNKIYGVVFTILTGMIVCNIFFHVVLGAHFTGYYDLVGFMAATGVLISFVLAETEFSHIKVDLIKYRDTKALKLLRTSLIFIVYTCFACAQYMAIYDSFFRSINNVMIEVTTYALYFISSICFTLLSVVSGYRVVKLIISKDGKIEEGRLEKIAEGRMSEVVESKEKEQQKREFQK
ncbi:MAG: hypothetical protein COA94_00270 [Rickettsiales bacterium]|nr:MAG: hypothetical protein COA94_00270 [Rickettsiales bacterium]